MMFWCVFFFVRSSALEACFCSLRNLVSLGLDVFVCLIKVVNEGKSVGSGKPGVRLLSVFLGSLIVVVSKACSVWSVCSTCVIFCCYVVIFVCAMSKFVFLILLILI